MIVKLLFDENIGKPLTDAIAGLLRFYDPKPEILHILDLMKTCGVRDETWVPVIANQNWMVITADRGRQGSGRPLPWICKDFKVTHILFSGTLHNQRQFERARAIITLWPEIVQAYKGPKGVEYLLQAGPKLARKGA